jgi:hypothetical protein
MNAPLALEFWRESLIGLALGSIGIVGLAAVVYFFVKPVQWRRTVWQTCFVCLLFYTVAELAGITRGASQWVAANRETKPQVVLLPRAADSRSPNFEGSYFDIRASWKNSAVMTLAAGLAQSSDNERGDAGREQELLTDQSRQAGREADVAAQSMVAPREENPRGAAREALVAKLHELRLDGISFESAPLREVLAVLNRQSRERDPDGKGVNFILKDTPDEHGRSLREAQIDIFPPLRNISIADALRAVLLMSEEPIGFSVEAYAVIFHRVPQPFHIRRYGFDPDTLANTVESIEGIRDVPDDLEERFRLVFRLAGLDLSLPKSVVVVNSNLLVWASLEDFKVIEQVLDSLPATRLDLDPANTRALFRVLRSQRQEAPGRVYLPRTLGDVVLRPPLNEPGTWRVNLPVRSLEGNHDPSGRLYAQTFYLDPERVREFLERKGHWPKEMQHPRATSRLKGALIFDDRFREGLKRYFVSRNLFATHGSHISFNLVSGILRISSNEEEVDRFFEAVQAMDAVVRSDEAESRRAVRTEGRESEISPGQRPRTSR